MKKVILALAILACTSVAFAGPFLVCDPQPFVDTYLFYNNGILLDPYPAQADGSAKIDLEGIEPGQYSFTLVACNIWGCGPASDPFEQTVGLPAKPSNLDVVR